jgi:hypothetical protein
MHADYSYKEGIQGKLEIRILKGDNASGCGRLQPDVAIKINRGG